MGTVEYSKLRAEHDRQVAPLGLPSTWPGRSAALAGDRPAPRAVPTGGLSMLITYFAGKPLTRKKY
jgi:hypothetical protein